MEASVFPPAVGQGQCSYFHPEWSQKPVPEQVADGSSQGDAQFSPATTGQTGRMHSFSTMIASWMTMSII